MVKTYYISFTQFLSEEGSEEDLVNSLDEVILYINEINDRLKTLDSYWRLYSYYTTNDYNKLRDSIFIDYYKVLCICVDTIGMNISFYLNLNEPTGYTGYKKEYITMNNLIKYLDELVYELVY